MNETRELWAILRAEDDSNGILAAGPEEQGLRILVASSDEGRDVIREYARLAWPDDDLIERRFVAVFESDVVLP